jgi:hypothetical protein
VLYVNTSSSRYPYAFGSILQFKLTLTERADVVITLRQSNVLEKSREWSTINMAMLTCKGG